MAEAGPIDDSGAAGEQSRFANRRSGLIIMWVGIATAAAGLVTATFGWPAGPGLAGAGSLFALIGGQLAHESRKAERP